MNPQIRKTKMIDIILGIDPGLYGAFALLNGNGDHPQGLEIFDMPVHEITVNGKKKKRADIYELARWLDAVQKSHRIVKAVVENVHAMPKQGVSSSFSFGFVAGAIQGILAAHFLPIELVSPRKWKQAMGLTANKDAARRRASQLMPGFAEKWSRAKDDGRAEAALLAYWWSKNGNL
jgi:crossover junction endodeoxyribonuclease RuvC